MAVSSLAARQHHSAPGPVRPQNWPARGARGNCSPPALRYRGRRQVLIIMCRGLRHQAWAHKSITDKQLCRRTAVRLVRRTITAVHGTRTVRSYSVIRSAARENGLRFFIVTHANSPPLCAGQFYLSELGNRSFSGMQKGTIAARYNLNAGKIVPLGRFTAPTGLELRPIS
eukprot:COSAG01_NODE_6849_length_3470_cov_2.296055_1_plen_170_part_10